MPVITLSNPSNPTVSEIAVRIREATGLLSWVTASDVVVAARQRGLTVKDARVLLRAEGRFTGAADIYFELLRMNEVR